MRQWFEINVTGRVFPGFPELDKDAWDDTGIAMTAHTQQITPRERFLQAAQKELVNFERREIEFRKQEREERAAELHLSIEKNKIH